MKCSRVMLLALSGLCFLSVGSAGAQTLYTLSVESKGTFQFDGSYPTGRGERMPFNFHGMRRAPKDGEKINYFVFKPSADVFKFMKSLSKGELFSSLEPCSRGVDQALSDRAQAIGGSIRPIGGRIDLLPYLKRRKLIETDGYVYVAIDSNLRNYVRSRNDFGWEWVALAAEKLQLCLYTGVGRMGFFSAMASVPVNVSRLAKFVFVDDE